MNDHDLLVRLDEKVGTLDKIVSKVSNGKQVDLIVKGAVAVLGLLELQARTGIEIGAAKEVPAAFIKVVLALTGGG